MKYFPFYPSILVALFFSFSVSNGYAQLTVVPNQTATVLASALAGPGVTILSPTLTCPGLANGTFTSTGTLLSMSSGIILTCGHASAAAGPYGPPPGTASFNLGAPGDPALTAILGGSNTYDACVLQFDVVAKGDSLGFNYQFGSQEYYSAVCSHYNDLFAFFISGPGIAGAPNMALIPGTNIPVEINSVNNGVPGASGGVLSNCTSLGPGSPFTSYYLDNTGGTLLSYKGFTTKFRAVHSVTPCDTYHLKLAIADAGNAIYDSGVFLEAASLNTNNFIFNHTDSIGATINGMSNSIVKGCNPATITILSTHILSTSEVLHFTFSGTGVNGLDYTAPDSAIMLSGTDSVHISVAGIPTFPSGIKTLKIFLTSPAACGILDSITLNILDSPAAILLTPDTTVCAGSTFQIHATGSSGLTYSWSPLTGLTSGTVMEPVTTPSVSTTYIMTATLPGSGCPDISRSINVTVIDATITMASHDTAFCNNGSVDLLVIGDPALHYIWTPATGLSNPDIQNPVATPTVTTTYTVTATSTTGACTDTAAVTITIENLNVPSFTVDTTICMGTAFQIIVPGNPQLSYNWSPATGLSNPNDQSPIASPAVATSYTLTVSVPGTNCMATDYVNVNLIKALITNVTPNQTIPFGSSVQLNSDNALYYFWTPDDGSLNNNNINNPIATPKAPTIYVVTAYDKYGCLATDSVKIDLTYDNIFIPDAFSPNNDGLNEVFRIGNPSYYKLVSMSIYNRWGELVYRAVDGNNKGWDGTYMGTPQDIGVYNYQIILAQPDGVEKYFKGTVTLIR